MEAVPIKPIEELEAPGLMRLDWYPGISANLQDPTNPYLHLLLTPVSYQKSNTGSGKFELKRVPNKKQVHTKIAVSLLPYLNIGQIFRNGKHAQLSEWPDIKTIEFELDSSNPENCKTYRLSDKYENNFDHLSQYTVSSEWRYHAENSHFKFIKGTLVQHNKSTGLIEKSPLDIILHDIELIKYYYTGSINLAASVFNGDFLPENFNRKIICTLHELPRYIPDTDTHRFVYQHGFFKNDAHILGRIIFTPDNLALTAVRKVANSLKLDSINKFHPEIKSPTSDFPFSGKTKLTLQGRFFQKKNAPRRFFVHKIVDCTYPYPFNNLSYCDAIDQRGEKANPENAKHFPQWNKKNKANKNNKTGKINSKERPCAESAGLHEQLKDRSYSALNNVNLDSEKLKENTHKSDGAIIFSDAILQNASTGKPTSGQTSSEKLKTEVLPDDTTLLSKNINLFIEAFSILKKSHPKWEINDILIGQDGGTEHGIQLSLFPLVACPNISKYRQHSFHDKEQSIRRRFVCYEVCINNRYAYLFEGESRYRIKKNDTNSEPSLSELSLLCLSKYDLSHCNQNDFDKMLKQTMTTGHWPSSEVLIGFNRDYKAHTSKINTSEEMSLRIETLITSVLINFK